MKTSLAALTVLLVGLGLQTGNAHQYKNEIHMSMVDGNTLYAECQASRRAITVTADGRIGEDLSDSADLFSAGECWGYILGIVDSIPVTGKGFSPKESVSEKQYIDVVFNYLQKHPESRNQTAYVLAWNALVQGFRKEGNSR